MKENKCFWSHNFDKWEQIEPYNMYATDKDVPQTKENTYLYYTIYKQQRKCKDCNYVEIESRRVNNY